MTIHPLSRPYHQEPPRLVLILALVAASWIVLAVVLYLVGLGAMTVISMFGGVL
jgi:hypothetical protein